MEKKLGGFAMLDEVTKTQEDFSSSIVTAEAVLNIAYALEEEFQKMMKNQNSQNQNCRKSKMTCLNAFMISAMYLSVMVI